jgi:hypothetical protein
MWRMRRRGRNERIRALRWRGVMGVRVWNRDGCGFRKGLGVRIRNSERLGGFGRVLGFCSLCRVGGTPWNQFFVVGKFGLLMFFYFSTSWSGGVGMCFTIADWSLAILFSFLFDTTKLSMLQHFLLFYYMANEAISYFYEGISRTQLIL